MANITWKNPVSDVFSNAADWTGGVVPGSGDTAILGALSGATYTVTVNTGESVDAIQTAANATLSVNGGAFTATAGTGSGANAGTISVANNNTFDTAGTFDNTGTISLNGQNGYTTVLALTSNATLSGGGKLTLSDSNSNFVEGTAATDTLTNTNDTISGSGQLGNGQLTLVNQAGGIIDATGSGNALVINTGANEVTNAGLIEATGSAGLTIQSTTVNNATGGTITANGANVNLATADIVGGTLTTANGGVIETVDGGSALDGTSSTVNNQGNVTVLNNTQLALKGVINNTATLTLAGQNGYTTLLDIAANASLTGAGHLTLSDSNSNFVEGAAAADTLTNTNDTISGAGQLGNGQLTLVNQATGVIDATGVNNQLVINTGAIAVSNAGLIEATGSDGLDIYHTTIANAATGIISAAGSHVDLQTADIQGGTLETSNGGVIDTVDGGSLFDGLGTHKVYVLGNAVINNNTSLNVQGNVELTQKVGKTVTNGTLTLNGQNGYSTQLIVTAKNATITGSEVILSDSNSNYIVGTQTKVGNNYKDSSLNNKSDIVGAGAIGSNLVLNNSLTIDATGANALIIQTGSSNVAKSNIVKNSGLIESTNPNSLNGVGGLLIRSTTIANSSKGVIEANGAATHVDLQTATITGGTLKTLAGGVIDTIDGGSVLNGTTSAIANQGAVVINDNTALTLEGAINNTGTVTLNGSNGYSTSLILGANTTLTGSGNIILSDSNSNYVYGAVAADTLTNTNNTISGAGQLGYGQLTLVNAASGVIDATGSGNQLVINTGANSVTNSGLIEATGSAGLNIYHTTINGSTGGIIKAIGTHIDLQTATIAGGTLEGSSGGYFDAVDGGSVLNGVGSTVNNQTTVQVNNNEALTLEGAIDNTGAITMTGVNGYSTDLIMGANTTLTGGGGLTLSDSNANFVYGAVAADTLTNTNNTISGAGDIGDGQMTLINQASGVIDATGTNNQLTINTGAIAVTNTGLIEATGSAGLNIYHTTIDGSTGGVISAVASHVDLQTATIVGGTLEGSSGGYVQAVDSGSVLNGTSATVNNQTTVTVLNNDDLTLEGAINNTGAITLSGVNGYSTQLILGANTTLSGSGQVTLSDSNANDVYGAVASDTLTNTNDTIAGAGNIGSGQMTLINQASGVIDATGTNNQLTINTGAIAVTNSGLIEATGSAGLRIAGTTVNGSTGGVISAVASHVDLQSANIAGGTIKSSGGGYFDTADNGSILNGVGSTLTDQAAVAVNNNSNLTIEGTIANTGTLSVNGVNGYSTQLILGANTTLTGSGQVTLSDSNANYVYGATASDTLTNGNTISGAGQLGNGQMTLANQAAGVIDATGTNNALIINTGSNTITNAGLIEATGSAGLTIDSAVTNTDIIAANGANVTVAANVGGTGSETITGAAKLEISSSFGAGAAQTVNFESGSTGTFKIDNAQNFTGTVAGFASGETLDLANISYATASLTYSGNSTSGTLTVKDGTNTAVIKLTGHYSQANFHLAPDANNDTDVTYSGTGHATAGLIQAMASFGAARSASASLSAASLASSETATLALPHHA